MCNIRLVGAFHPVKLFKIFNGGYFCIRACEAKRFIRDMPMYKDDLMGRNIHYCICTCLPCIIQGRGCLNGVMCHSCLVSSPNVPCESSSSHHLPKMKVMWHTASESPKQTNT